MRRASARWLAGLAAAGAAAAGCRGNTGGPTGAPVCSPAVCKLSSPVRWAVAVDPPASSGFAPRQSANMLVADGMFLQVDSTTLVKVTLSPPAGAGPIPPQGDVMLSIPPTIPGLPNLSPHSPLTAQLDGSVVAWVPVPTAAVRPGATALLILQPRAPGDQTLPSYRWQVPLSASISLTLPSDDLLVDGQLLNSVGMPLKTSFVARAFQNGIQVSDAPAVQSSGAFEIRIPSVVAADPVTLLLAPTMPANADPWFVSTPLTALPGENLGTINLPAYGVPPTFFNVVTMDASGASIQGVLITALTSLGNAVVSGGAGGAATFQNSAVTDARGIAHISLLPGGVNLLPYFVLATPPSGSPYAIQCVTAQAGTGASDPNQATTLAGLKLIPRPVLEGTVQTADGTPLPNVTVSATGTPDPPAPTLGCPEPAPVSAGTTTDARGAFSLPLDPGTYRIDYDPPRGALAPRMTTAPVMVSSALEPQSITLQPGTWLTGSVLSPDPDRLPVASAAVRFFQVCNDPTGCPGGLAVSPPLVAATLTDAAGRFQVAVPAPPQ